MNTIIGIAIGFAMGIVATMLYIIVSYDRYKEKNK